MNLKQYLMLQQKSKVSMLLAFILIFSSLFILSSIVLTISFNKPIGDDYSFYNLYHGNDWIHQLNYTLQTMNGRYAQNISAAVLYKVLGMTSTLVLPVLALVWFYTLIVLVVRRFILPQNKRWQSLVVAAVIVAMFYIAPSVQELPILSVFQTLLWAPGIITYTLPLLILLSTLYFTLRSYKTKLMIAVWILAVFITGLFNEIQPTTVLCLSVLTILPAIKYKNQRRPLFYYIGASVIASVASLLLIYVSAANQARRTIAHAQSIDIHLVADIWQRSIAVFHDFSNLESMVLFTIVGIFIYSISRKSDKNYTFQASAILVLFVVYFILSVFISCTLLTVGYGVNGSILNRTLLIPQLLFVCLFIYAGILIGPHLEALAIKNRYIKVTLPYCLIALLLASLPVHILTVRKQVISSVTYMTSWIVQDNQLKEAARQDPSKTIYVDRKISGIGDGYSLTCYGPHVADTSWLNIDIQRYYGVKRICLAGESSYESGQR